MCFPVCIHVLVVVVKTFIFPQSAEWEGLRLQIISAKRVQDKVAVEIEFRWTQDKPDWAIKNKDSCLLRQYSTAGKMLGDPQREHFTPDNTFLQRRLNTTLRLTITMDVDPACSILEIKFGALRVYTLIPRSG